MGLWNGEQGTIGKRIQSKRVRRLNKWVRAKGSTGRDEENLEKGTWNHIN